jgi:hypothetical protein
MTSRSATTRCAMMLAACGLVAGSISVRAQQGPTAGRPVMGELRLIAVEPGNARAIDALHHSGWLEADGRILKRTEFPDLFAGIGLAWTTRKVMQDQFAVPDLVERRGGVSSDNPYGVLGGGDLVTGGRQIHRAPAPQYFIYAGQDVSGAAVALGTSEAGTRGRFAAARR